MDSIEETNNEIPDYSPTVTVTEREFNGIPVTQIEIDRVVYSIADTTYILGLNNQTTLVIATSKEARPVAERLLSTFSLN
jgi:hypothetical protein